MTGFMCSRGIHASETQVGASLQAACPQYQQDHQQVGLYHDGYGLMINWLILIIGEKHVKQF